MRGHRCSYRIKLTQRLGFVNYWFVEELGSHDQLNGKDCDFKVNSQIASTLMDANVMDLSQSLKMKLPNIPKSQRKLAPKPVPKPSSEKTNPHNDTDATTAEGSADVPTSYHYVLGSITNGSPSSESLSRLSPSQTSMVIDAFPSVSSSQHCAIDSLYDGILPASLQANSPVLPGCLQSVSLNSMNPVLQTNLVNYMSTMTNLGLGASLQNGLNPFLVNIKQEPTEDGQNVLSYASTFPVLPTHVPYPPSQSQSPVRQSSTSHSPSPSKSQGQGYRDRSPLCRDQSPNRGIQKGLELEAKIQKEASHKMQAHHDTLGQVHSRIMERAKSRKSAHTVRVPRNTEADVVDLSRSKTDTSAGQNCLQHNSIINSLPDTIKGDEKSYISSLAFQRFKTLNHVIRSEVFQNAKNQLEKKKILENGNKADSSEDGALNLVVSEKKGASDAPRNSYYRLAEEWKEGRELSHSPLADGEEYSDKGEKVDSLVNGGLGELSEALLQTGKLTQNEKVYFAAYSYIFYFASLF